MPVQVLVNLALLARLIFRQVLLDRVNFLETVKVLVVVVSVHFV